MNPLLGFLFSEFVMSLPWIPRERAKMESEDGFEELGLGFVIMIASQLCHCLLSYVQGFHCPDHLATSLHTHAHTCAHSHTRTCTHRPSDCVSVQHCFPLQSWNGLPLLSTYVWVRPPQIFNSLFYFSRDFESLLTCQRNFPPSWSRFLFVLSKNSLQACKKREAGFFRELSERADAASAWGAWSPWVAQEHFICKRKDRGLLFSLCLNLHFIRHPVGWFVNWHLHSQISLSTPNLPEGKTRGSWKQQRVKGSRLHSSQLWLFLLQKVPFVSKTSEREKGGGDSLETDGGSPRFRRESLLQRRREAEQAVITPPLVAACSGINNSHLASVSSWP